MAAIGDGKCLSFEQWADEVVQEAGLGRWAPVPGLDVVGECPVCGEDLGAIAEDFLGSDDDGRAVEGWALNVYCTAGEEPHDGGDWDFERVWPAGMPPGRNREPGRPGSPLGWPHPAPR